RVAQDRLESLHEDSLRRLFEAGMMDKIYAHLLSLENFRRLLNRRSFFALKPPSDSRELN
ncbi:MAG TPA: SapC family protein, partial [Burkholderiales bacterium]